MENPGESANPTAKTQQRITYGEILPDDTVLDLVNAADQDGLALLAWDGKGIRIRAAIDFDGISYRPPTLHSSIRAAIRFPKGASAYGTTLELFNKVAGAYRQHLKLAEDWAALATGVTLSSWVIESMLVSTTLLISGAFVPVYNAMRLFGALCRRGLVVAKMNPRLPFCLRPTLIANDPTLDEDSCDFWRAASCHGLFVAGAGSTLSALECTKIVVLQPDQGLGLWGPEAMFLPLPPADVPPLSDRLLADIAAEFQPQLEMFRLRMLSGVEAFVPKSHPLERFQLVRNLLAFIPADEEIVGMLTPLLESIQQGLAEWGPRDPQVAILQGIWGPCHQQKELSVADVTMRTNTLLQALGDTYVYNSKEIGWRLRNLKLSTRSDGNARYCGSRARIAPGYTSASASLGCSCRFLTTVLIASG